jgi:oligopeptide transport system substrate-binding protein
MGVEIQSLDPSEAEDFVTVRILMNLDRGLISYNKDLKPLPALAQSWKISKDKKVFTFKLKKSFWSDGAPIKAQDFVRGLDHTYATTTAAKLATPFKDLVQSYKAIDESTLEFHLRHPATYFLNLLALPFAFPQPEKTNFKISVGSPTSGPYVLQSLTQEKIVLAPNLKSTESALNVLEFRVIKEQSSAMNLFEKGEIDFIDRVPSSDYDRIIKTPALAKDLRKAPWLATYYIGFNLTRPPFTDKKARLAFVQAINRDETIKVLRDPQKAGSSFVPRPMEPSDMEFGPRFNSKEAKKNWAEVKDAPTSLDLYFDSQEKNNLIVSRIQKQIETNLNLKLNLKGMEWKSYLGFLKDPHGPAFYRFAWLATFPDPLSHLQVFKSDSPNNYSGFKNEKYDKLVDSIAEMSEGAKRKQLIVAAQKILLDDEIVIMPLFHYVQYLLIQDRWQGLDLSPMGILYFQQAHQ